jgi:hypothetical protein
VATRALAVVVLNSGLAVAEAQPNAVRADAVPGSAPEHTASALPAVPKLELSLPPVQTRAVYQPESLRRAESPPWPAYWDAVQRLRAWRDAGDAELRLTIETASFQWGDFAVSAGITSLPERERACAPSCAGAAWSSSVILRYPLGDAHPLRDVGPLRDVAPEIEVGTRPGAERRGSPGVVNAGVRGAF